MAEACKTQNYLEYLDKEMSIMGVLSAVSVIAPGGILSVVLASDKGPANALWTASSFFLVAGAAMCIFAAMCFYGERSKLAWFYGQICLTEALEKDDVLEIRERLREADSWESWWRYSWGFDFLIAGFVEFLFAAFLYLAPSHWALCKLHLHFVKIIAFVMFPCIVAVTAVLQRYVFIRCKFSDYPWKDFWRAMFMGRLSVSPPHAKVYARLRPSSIHGVGAFAIVDIPKGTFIFEPDDNPTVKIDADGTKVLIPAMRQLYKDFCVLTNGTYECPPSFNQLTPSWYLNHSSVPNVAPDDSLQFYATRDIRAGEELTADYGSYSENESDSEVG
jgi:hypothetical protein